MRRMSACAPNMFVCAHHTCPSCFVSRVCMCVPRVCMCPAHCCTAILLPRLGTSWCWVNVVPGQELSSRAQRQRQAPSPLPPGPIRQAGGAGRAHQAPPIPGCVSAPLSFSLFREETANPGRHAQLLLQGLVWAGAEPVLPAPGPCRWGQLSSQADSKTICALSPGKAVFLWAIKLEVGSDPLKIKRVGGAGVN